MISFHDDCGEEGIEESEELDENYVKGKLKESEYLLTYLASKDKRSVPLQLRNRLSKVVEKFNQLLKKWISCDLVEDGCCIEDELWENNFLMKYLFKDFIRESTSVKNQQKRLTCLICKTSFASRSINLIVHLKSLDHIVNYEKIRTKSSPDESFWGNFQLLKFLFEDYILRLKGQFYCKICCDVYDEEFILDHIKSVVHMKEFLAIVNFNQQSYDEKYKYEEILDSLNPVELNDGNLKVKKVGSILSLKKHDEFLKLLNQVRLYNKFIPFFCQLCFSFKVNMDLEGPPNMTVHLHSEKHMAAILLISELQLIEYSRRYCEHCSADLFTTCGFFDYHVDCHVHVQVPPNGKISKGCNGTLDSARKVEDKELQDINNIVADKLTEETDNIMEDNTETATDCQSPDLANSVVERDMMTVLNSLSKNLENVIDNLSIEDVQRGSYRGMFCYPCMYWSTHIHDWTKHINRNELHKYYCNVNSSYVVKICDCFVVLVGDKTFFNVHNKTSVHKRLSSFITKHNSAYYSTEYCKSQDTESESVEISSKPNKDVEALCGNKKDNFCLDSSWLTNVMYNELFVEDEKKQDLDTTELPLSTQVGVNEEKKDLSKLFEIIPQVGYTDDVFRPWVTSPLSEEQADSKMWPNTEKEDINRTTNLVESIDNHVKKEICIQSAKIKNSNQVLNYTLVDNVVNARKENIKLCNDVNENHICINNGLDTASIGSQITDSSSGEIIKTGKDDQQLINVRNKSYVLGLRGLAQGTESSAIVTALKAIGEVQIVHRVDCTSVNVTINGTLNDKIFGSSLEINGRKIVVGPVIKKINAIPDFIKTELANYEAFMSMVKTLTEKSREAAVRMTICETIDTKTSKLLSKEECLIKALKQCCSNIMDVKVIGSRATQLAYEDSTYDIFITFCHSAFGRLPAEVTDNERVNVLKESLMASSEFNCIRISEVDCRFKTVNVVYKPFSIECRLFPTLGFVLDNTNLINAYLRGDERIKTFFLIIREWARQVTLTSVISAHGVTWLLLFYLMHEGVILPTNKMAVGSGQAIAGWTCKEYKTVNAVVKDEKKTIHELFCGFLFFCSSSLITRKVLCPTTGKLVAKDWFKHKSILNVGASNAACTNTGRRNIYCMFPLTDGICLQDPLEHQINLTERLCGVYLNTFKNMCKHTLNELRTYMYR